MSKLGILLPSPENSGEIEVQKSKLLSNELGLPMVMMANPNLKAGLQYSSEGLAGVILDTSSISGMRAKPSPVVVNFESSESQHLRKSLGKNQPLPKAIGVGKGVQCIWDLTFGLGKDAFALHCLGLNVVGFEANPWIFALARDGLLRLQDSKNSDAVENNMKLIFQDSRQLFQEKNFEILSDIKGKYGQPDVLYWDPLFSSAEKQSASSKEMLLLHIFNEGVDSTTGIEEAIENSFSFAKKRVVVKRPLKGKFLTLRKPNYAIAGKSIRFDVYQN